MSNRNKREPGAPVLCAYCNYRTANSREHVFAKGLFIPTPNPPIIVPACSECNSGYGDGCHRKMTLDEEYFRQVLVMVEGAERHPVAAKILYGPAQRVFSRSPGLRLSFLKATREELVLNESGELIETASFVPEWERVQRVLKKITRGLFYHHMQRAMNVETALTVRCPIDEQAFANVIRELQDFSHVGPIGLGEQGAVIYVGARSSEQSDDTMWLFNFYRVFSVYAMTVSRKTAVEWGSA
jgi:hypothetical protein